MFCKNCGSKLDDDSNFCPKCGSAIVNEEATEELTDWQKPLFSTKKTNYKSALQNDALKKKKTKGTRIALIVLAAIFFIFLLSCLGETSSDENATAQSQASVEAVDSEPIFTPVTGTVGHWEITVDDFNYTDSVSTGLLTEYQSEDNANYCIVNVTVKNTGSTSDTFLPWITWSGTDDTYTKLVWNGYEYTRSELFFSRDNLSSEDLNPLVATSGELAFEVPIELIDSDAAPVLKIYSGNSVFECQLVKR